MQDWINTVKKLGASTYALYVIAMVIGLALPIVVTDDFVTRILILTYFYVMFASSWNLLAYSGQASLGHAAFLGIGGFASTILVKHGITPIIGVLGGAATAALVGLFLGVICVRLKEWFLGLVTFGFAIILAAVVNESAQFIEAFNAALSALGLPASLDPGMLGGSFGMYSPNIVAPGHYYYLFFLAMLGTVASCHLIIRSKIGFAFAAIRENPDEASMMGVDITRYKLLAFLLSTFLAGFAGALFAPYNYFINPEIFSIHYSFMPIIMTISGGIGTIGGPIVGAIAVNLLWEQMGLMGMSINRLLVLGGILILEILFLPRGVMPLLKKAWSRIWTKATSLDTPL